MSDINDIIYEPIQKSAPYISSSGIAAWQLKCRRIIDDINNKGRKNNRRNSLPLNRRRPIGALLLEEFYEHWINGHTQFWRVEYHDPFSLIGPYYRKPFSFNGVLYEAHECGSNYAAFEQVGYSIPRSIEDANLVSNTYTHSYIFTNQNLADDALSDIIKTYSYP